MRCRLVVAPLALAAVVVGGCARPARLTVFAGADVATAATAFAAFIPGDLVRVQPSADPEAALAAGRGPRAALVTDLDCGDCFSIDSVGGGGYRVHGGSLLGVQYGLAQLLEEGGVRFYHPRRTHVPASLALPASAPAFGHVIAPEMTLRGLHLHTLHPIEAYFDFWEPSPAHLEGARRVIDWLVKNRGN